MRLEWGSDQAIGVGFRNLSSACYANAPLQALIHLPPLAQMCLDGWHSR